MPRLLAPFELRDVPLARFGFLGPFVPWAAVLVFEVGSVVLFVFGLVAVVFFRFVRSRRLTL